MKIAFDAKRAFFNSSGLGNYSRNTISLLNKYYNNNQYYLATPSLNNNKLFDYGDEFKLITPTGISKHFKSIWRSYFMVDSLIKENIDIYHGLSNELPVNINKSKIKSIVTIHDLIFIRYPELYKAPDRFIYNKKFKHSCNIADKVIAISLQTKEDIVNFYNIDERKIEIVYQGCNKIFYNVWDDSSKEKIKAKYNLPSKHLLYVGTIEERKNLLLILKAINVGKIDMPIVVAGRATKYIDIINKYIVENNMQNKVHFYHNLDFADLPAFYQCAEMLIYPSFFEGFGIPIVEAMVSGIPVITSTGSCFKETGGKSTMYINPDSVDELIEAITKILSDESLKQTMIVNGFEHAKKFTDDKIAENIMNVYKSVM